MRLIFLADLHFSLKQYDWLLAHAGQYDLVIIGGDLLDLSSTLDIDSQIMVIEKYLARLTKSSRLAVSSGNHDGDSRNAADEPVAKWLLDARSLGYHADGEGFDFLDFRITVCPWWDGELARSEIQNQLEREAGRVRGRWMWIYHAPPEGAATCWSGRKYIGEKFCENGSTSFNPTWSSAATSTTRPSSSPAPGSTGSVALGFSIRAGNRAPSRRPSRLTSKP